MQGIYDGAAYRPLSGPVAIAVKVGGWLLCLCLAVASLVAKAPPWLPLLIQILPWAFVAWLSISRNLALLNGTLKPVAPLLIGIPMISGFSLIEAPNFLMLDQSPIYIAAGGLTLVYTLIIARPLVQFDREESDSEGQGQRQSGSLLAVILLGTLMGFSLNMGLITNLNGLSQSHGPEILGGLVKKRFTSDGRGPDPYLRISGPAQKIEDRLHYGAFETDYDRWGRVKVGMKACVAIHTGLFGWRWYDFVDC